jgi:hypothetical protein
MKDQDVELLECVLEREDLSPSARAAFEEMAALGKDLTAKQRGWAQAALRGDRYEAEPEYENLVSSGRCPRGREVELMVKDKPLKPPSRRTGA